jgi:hypothetical protein
MMRNAAKGCGEGGGGVRRLLWGRGRRGEGSEAASSGGYLPDGFDIESGWGVDEAPS